MDEYGEKRDNNIVEKLAWVRSQMEQHFQGTEFEDLIKPTYKKKRTGPVNEENLENQPPKKRKRSSTKDSITYRSTARLQFTRKYNTRSAGKKNDNENDNDDESKKRPMRKGRSLKVIFPFAKSHQREIDLEKFNEDDYENSDENDESDDDNYRSKKQKSVFRVSKSVYDPSKIPSPNEITDEMLKKIAQRTSDKVYSQQKGISCHQCRQKTMDTKTVCRSGECMGTRGQFCGPCLRGRYGEDAATVLKDPNWICPPCRGLCNCSRCRTRNGQRPTGMLAPIAKEEGYQSVMDYLQATSGDELEEEEEEEEEEEGEGEDRKTKSGGEPEKEKKEDLKATSGDELDDREEEKNLKAISGEEE